jgi:hypothetical protein
MASDSPRPAQPSGHVSGWRRARHWRKMTWGIVAWLVVMVIWAVAVSGSQTCQSAAYGAVRLCSGGLDVGKWLGISAGGLAILCLIWFMTKPQTRLCPACGESVKKGPTRCPNCSFDFAAAASGAGEGSSSD